MRPNFLMSDIMKSGFMKSRLERSENDLENDLVLSLPPPQKNVFCSSAFLLKGSPCQAVACAQRC